MAWQQDNNMTWPDDMTWQNSDFPPFLEMVLHDESLPDGNLPDGVDPDDDMSDYIQPNSYMDSDFPV